MKIPDLIKRVDLLIEKSNGVLATSKFSNGMVWVNNELFFEFKSSSLSFLENIFGVKHSFYLEFNKGLVNPCETEAERGRGILKAVKNEIESGWFFKVKDLISAEIFSNFLEMAEYLLNENYKDPAAVMIGGVLEEHLRQLCLKNSIPTTIIKKDGKEEFKKSDLLNADLAKENVYNKLDQKNITAWLDLRNKAAHGHYDEYTEDQVILMYQAVLNFISRNSV